MTLMRRSADVEDLPHPFLQDTKQWRVVLSLEIDSQATPSCLHSMPLPTSTLEPDLPTQREAGRGSKYD